MGPTFENPRMRENSPSFLSIPIATSLRDVDLVSSIMWASVDATHPSSAATPLSLLHPSLVLRTSTRLPQ